MADGIAGVAGLGALLDAVPIGAIAPPPRGRSTATMRIAALLPHQPPTAH
jgi:hypothetical protein